MVAGDEVIDTQAGKGMHGLDHFLVSLSGKPVPGMACFILSLVYVQARRSFPRRVVPVVRSAKQKAARKAQAAAQQTKSPCTKEFSRINLNICCDRKAPGDSSIRRETHRG